MKLLGKYRTDGWLWLAFSLGFLVFFAPGVIEGVLAVISSRGVWLSGLFSFQFLGPLVLCIAGGWLAQLGVVALDLWERERAGKKH
jgi:hypothetical protein